MLNTSLGCFSGFLFPAKKTIFVAMLRRLLHIALLLILVGGFFGPAESGSAATSHIEASLSDTGVEERALVRQHAHLNLPTSVESVGNTASLSVRLGNKQTSRHLTSWSIADALSHTTHPDNYGGFHGLHTAIGESSRSVLNRLCRLRI